MTAYDALVENLRELGYGPSKSADRWGVEVWSRKGCPALRVPAECSEVSAEKLRVQMHRDMDALASKKKPKAFRRRVTKAKHDLSVEKRRREIEARIAASNRELDGAREVLTAAESRAIQARIESDERELRTLQSLMTSIPGPRADLGRPRARHHS